jgi:uncharacterized protein YndB with AHSA1/START domain
MTPIMLKGLKHITMETQGKTEITVETLVNAPEEIVWKYWTTPEAITRWNYASEDWHTPKAENDLRDGGKFNFRMESKDGSMGFDFWGVYNKIIPNRQIEYTIGDGRKVRIDFFPLENKTEIVEVFEAETENPIEMQRGGWQAILDNFKRFTEKNIS